MITSQKKEPLAELVEKAIELSVDGKFKEFYFNPLFVKDLYEMVPDLKNQKFKIESVEFREDDGLHIHSKLIAPDTVFLDLGELILTGTSIQVVKNKPLQPIVSVVDFIRQKTQGG